MINRFESVINYMTQPLQRDSNLTNSVCGYMCVETHVATLAPQFFYLMATRIDNDELSR